MSKFIMRLDDAAEKMDIEKWDRMEQILDKFGIKPLVGVIPICKDPMMEKYEADDGFWDKVHRWMDKGWTIALHGYEHVYCTEDGGINPVNKRSEFAGLPLDEQKRKISEGVNVFREHGIEPDIFFAPSHTFDENTIKALKEESNIKIISDTIANKPYTKYGMTFVPQQSGIARKLPFSVVTFCYHPNLMTDDIFNNLEIFLQRHNELFVDFPKKSTCRRFGLFDQLLHKLYFLRK